MILSLGITKANEVPLAALAPALTASAGGLAAAPGQVGQVSSSVIDAHLAGLATYSIFSVSFL